MGKRGNDRQEMEKMEETPRTPTYGPDLTFLLMLQNLAEIIGGVGWALGWVLQLRRGENRWLVAISLAYVVVLLDAS